MTEAVIYCRISRDAAGQGLGVTRQRDDATSLAHARGWTITETLVDNDISASGRRHRPGFERLITLLTEGRTTVVVAWTLDRLTRNRADTVRLIEAAQDARATIALVRGSDLDMSSPAGRLTADLLAAVARSEIETKADRHQRAAQQAAEAGRWHGGVRPFGYESDGVSIRAGEAGAIAAGAQWILDGVPLADIARRWNDNGTPTTSGHDWDGKSVAQVMRRARNAGLRRHQGNPIGPAEWPEIIDPDTWHAVLAVLNDPGRRHRRHDAWLLTGGIALCGRCGAPMQAGTSSGTRIGGKKEVYPTYRCSAAAHLNRHRGRVDAVVEEAVITYLSRPDIGTLLPADSPDLSGITDEIDTLRQRSDRLADAYADGTVDLQQLTRANTRIAARLTDLEQQLAAAAPTLQRGLSIVHAPDPREAWQELTLQARKDVIRALATVWVDPIGKGKRREVGVRVEWLT
ncbi:recombinase family protein [Enemella dayhoffiae]|nr:recombinase family protein [Enemella dayhoffiae]